MEHLLRSFTNVIRQADSTDPSGDKFIVSLPEHRFRQLAEYFPKMRDEGGGNRDKGGLDAGILRNVSLVIDEPCVDSVLSRNGHVDGVWVWDVDLDYFISGTGGGTDLQKDQDDGFPGFLRVRLQQLVNNFYEARRFHAHDPPTYSTAIQTCTTCS